ATSSEQLGQKIRSIHLERSTDHTSPIRAGGDRIGPEGIVRVVATSVPIGSRDTGIVHVVGARPNFVKAAPVVSALRARGAHQTVVHTGQHYDDRMSAVFFRDLGLPTPDVDLGVGSGSHASQTAALIVGLEKEFVERNPVRSWSMVTSTRRWRRRSWRPNSRSPSRTWRRACAPSTTPCPRRSTAGAPTSSATCVLPPAPRRSGTSPREGSPRTAYPWAGTPVSTR